MSDTSFAAGGGDDDLPRTVRQQKEQRARDQMAREILNAPRPAYGKQARAAAMANAGGGSMAADYATHAHAPGEDPPATVTRLQLPFFHMMRFFIKAVLAAIPALILLMLILWAFGQAAQMYLPWLVKMKVLVTFPG